jgi:hypothetical protein
MIIDKGWRVVAVAMAAGMAGGLMAGKLFVGEPAMAQSPPADVVSAREFRLVDGTGKPIASWVEGALGARMIFGRDPAHPRAVVGALDNGDPGVSLFDGEGGLRADFRVGSGNFPTLRLTDIKGKKTALLGAHGMGLFNKQLRGRFVLTSEGNLTVDVADQDTRLSSALMLAAKEKSALTLSDGAGKAVWSSP